MAILLSDANSVRFLKTFRIMPWTYKVVEFGQILIPAVFTWMAVANQGQEFYGTFWICAAVISWLFLAITASYYARGYLAERRGVRPAPPDKRPDLELNRRMLIIFGILVGLIFLIVIYKFLRHPDHFTGHDWAGEIILPALLIQFLSSYLRNRFWDASFE